jgi:hypothetical protein
MAACNPSSATANIQLCALHTELSSVSAMQAAGGISLQQVAGAGFVSGAGSYGAGE